MPIGMEVLVALILTRFESVKRNFLKKSWVLMGTLSVRRRRKRIWGTWRGSTSASSPSSTAWLIAGPSRTAPDTSFSEIPFDLNLRRPYPLPEHFTNLTMSDVVPSSFLTTSR